MSIASEIERISGNVQSTIDTIRATGVTVPEGANSDDLPSLAQALATTKQDKLTGTAGQVVGFDAEGNAEAQDAPESGIKIESTELILPKSSMADIAYGNGVYVTFSPFLGGILYSRDAVQWTEVDRPPGLSVPFACTFGNGRFFVVGQSGSVVAYSDDGIFWETSSLPESGISLCDVAAQNDQVFAISPTENTNIIVKSKDNGETWSKLTLPQSANWAQIAAGGQYFVALTSDSNVLVYWDSNTASIAFEESSLPASGPWSKIAYGGDNCYLVLKKNSNVGYYVNANSPGSTWTPVTLPISGNWGATIYANGIWVAISGESESSDDFIYSTDMINWTAGKLPKTSKWKGITYGNGKFVAVSSNSPDIVCSKNGITWTNNVSILVDSDGTDVTEEVSEILGVTSKQDKLIGTAGQVVGFDSQGNAIAQDAPESGMTQTEADGRYLQLSGGTMTGALTLNGNPSADNQAANKAYVDSKAPKYVSVTLSASGWASNSQTVTVQGVVADETAQFIQPMPAIASQAAYMAAGIYCSGQAANSLTFTCQTAPTENITVYVVMQEVSAA